jgi:hypothetical protein
MGKQNADVVPDPDRCSWCGAELPPGGGWCNECEHFGRSRKPCRHCAAPLQFAMSTAGDLTYANWCRACEKDQGSFSRFSVSSQSATAIVTVVATLIALLAAIGEFYDKIVTNPAEVQLFYENYDAEKKRVKFRATNEGEHASTVTLERLIVRTKSLTRQAPASCIESGKSAQEISTRITNGEWFCVPLGTGFVVKGEDTQEMDLDWRGFEVNSQIGTKEGVSNDEFECEIEFEATGSASESIQHMDLSKIQCLALVGG